MDLVESFHPGEVVLIQMVLELLIAAGLLGILIVRYTPILRILGTLFVGLALIVTVFWISFRRPAARMREWIFWAVVIFLEAALLYRLQSNRKPHQIEPQEHRQLTSSKF